MPAAYAKGAPVRQVQTAPIVGTVVGFHVDQETGDLQYLVEWTDAAGEVRSRYFTAEQLQAA